MKCGRLALARQAEFEPHAKRQDVARTIASSLGIELQKAEQDAAGITKVLISEALT